MTIRLPRLVLAPSYYQFATRLQPYTKNRDIFKCPSSAFRAGGERKWCQRDNGYGDYMRAPNHPQCRAGHLHTRTAELLRRHLSADGLSGAPTRTCVAYGIHDCN
jgi:hypothetical protein